MNLYNGYKKVQFHIQGYLKDYTKEHIKNIVEVVADILDCETQEIFVNGVKPSNSFFLVLSLKEVYSRRLSEMNKQDRLRLMKLNIDFFIVDFSTIFLQSREGKLFFHVYFSYFHKVAPEINILVCLYNIAFVIFKYCNKVL